MANHFMKTIITFRRASITIFDHKYLLNEILRVEEAICYMLSLLLIKLSLNSKTSGFQIAEEKLPKGCEIYSLLCYQEVQHHQIYETKEQKLTYFESFHEAAK